MSNSVVEVNNVSKSYHRNGLRIPVLENINLSVPEGEFLAMMGPSGAGKSMLLLTKLSKGERNEHVKTALDVVSLGDRLRHYPRQLSGGQQQRVAIARAIVADPTLIVADEPTGDLDRNSAIEILTLLERLNQEFKKTIIMVTHDHRAAEKAQTVRHLEKGELM